MSGSVEALSVRSLTSWSSVMYFFHHKYFWYCGPMADIM